MLPLLYHAHHNLHLEDLPYWLDLARQQGGPVLELGCGTGRVLLPLAQAGFSVFGLDHDPAMLVCLEKNRRQILVRPELARVALGDMTGFRFDLKFPLVILPCNTLSTLELARRRAMLACVSAHLAPGGVFAASLPNPQLLEDLPQRSDAELEETFLHPQTGNEVQVFSAWRRTSTHFNVTWHYHHLLSDGSLERFSAKARHLRAPAEDYCKDITAAGLNIRVLYGDFEKHSYTPDADDLIIEAIKPPA